MGMGGDQGNCSLLKRWKGKSKGSVHPGRKPYFIPCPSTPSRPAHPACQEGTSVVCVS